jgi:hypothetical protein
LLETQCNFGIRKYFCFCDQLRKIHCLTIFLFSFCYKKSNFRLNPLPGVEEVEVGSGELKPAPHHTHEGDQLTLLAHHQLLMLLKHRNIKSFSCSCIMCFFSSDFEQLFGFEASIISPHRALKPYASIF